MLRAGVPSAAASTTSGGTYAPAIICTNGSPAAKDLSVPYDGKHTALALELKEPVTFLSLAVALT
jgi:hypothetical protein